MTNSTSAKALSTRRVTGILAGLFLILGTSLLVMSGNPEAELTSSGLWSSDVFKWLITVLLLCIVFIWEQNRLDSLGIRLPSWQDLVLIPGIAIVILLVQNFVGTPLLNALGMSADLSTLKFLQELSADQKISITLTAGVTEEIIYRSYIIERIETLTGSTVLSVVVSIAFFVGVHLPLWGLGSGIQQTLITVIFALVYVWRRNVFVPIGAHILIDASGIFQSLGITELMT